jgi:6-phosphogluconolactonase
MTFPVLNLARRTVFLASGKDKAEVLKTVLENTKVPLPAQKVRPSKGSVTWLVDREAASLLRPVNRRLSKERDDVMQ